MFGLTDAECFLLGWAVVMTILYFKEQAEKDVAKKMLMYFIRDEKAREEILAQWDAFKKKNGVA